MIPNKKQEHKSRSIRYPLKSALHSTINFGHFLKYRLIDFFGSSSSLTREFETIEQLISTGNFNEALEVVKTIEIMENISPTDQLIYYLLKSNIMNNLSHFEEGLKLAEVAYKDGQRLRKRHLRVDALITMIDSLRGIGKYNESLEVIVQGEKELDELAQEQPLMVMQRKPTILLMKGSIYWRKGELDQAFKYCQQSLTLYEKIGNQRLIADALSNLGIISRDKGDLDQALIYCQRSLALQEKIGHTQAIATTLNNIGIIYRDKGGLNQALEYYKQSIAYFKKIDHKLNIAASLNNIGEIYYLRDDLDQALVYHEKSLAISEETGNNLFMSYSLFYLVSVALNQDSLNQAQQYLHRLRRINVEEDNKIISQQYRIAEALILKNSPRTRDKGKAEELFANIINEEITQSEVTILALLNLCDLLISDLRVSGAQEVLDEAQSLVNRLLKIAKQQHSHWVLAETYMLQSKLALVELDLIGARQLLEKAQQIAEKRGLHRLAMRISTEHDTLLGQLNQWEDIIERNASISERVELAQLEDVLMKMVRKQVKTTPELQHEEPVMLLIITEDGITFYSKLFDEDDIMDESIIGGFLAAINTFVREAFAISGSIERIKHQEHTLLFNSMEPFLVCYIFKGPSYFARQKLGQFTNALQTSDIVWQILTDSYDSGRTLADNVELEKLFTKIFHTPAEDR